MNKDFHYYGTYLAARGVGFSHDEARKIAWAAQMTDDCTEELLNETPGSGSWTHRVATCQNMREMSAANMSRLSDPNNDILRKVRNIWMPFHFLPGNLSMRYSYAGERVWGRSDYDPVRDGADFKCICLHNSELVYQMVDETRHAWNAAANDAGREKLLYLLGIRMHVLADTWAHEYFAGTPNYWVNEVEEIQLLEGRSVRTGAAPDGVSFYSMLYLGHAQAGHYPDYGNIAYTYSPHWLKKSATLVKNNPLLFLAAFCQMQDAMNAVRRNESFPQGLEYNGIPGDRELAPQGITAGNILSVLNTPVEDQSDAWKTLLHNRGIINDMEAFDYRTADPAYSLKDFCECAEIQRHLVERHLTLNNIRL